MDFTDFLHLNDSKIFQNVRQGLASAPGKTTNLLTIKDSVLYAWDFTNSCVLTLNVKAARSRDGDNVHHQSLLPLLPVLFKPESVLVNESGSLLIVSGPSGVLVLELPARCAPHGAFDNRKELVYCRSHTLDERFFMSNDVIHVRQVKFHPGSIKDNHILVLTSDNTLRLYTVENQKALHMGNFPVGEKPGALFPGTRTTYLAAFGEVGVDFDFGHTELNEYKSNLVKYPQNGQGNRKWSDLAWPVYVLRGDGSIYVTNVPLDGKTKSTWKGPLPSNSNFGPREESCSIIALNTNPQILCVANSSGTIYHSLVLPIDEVKFEELRSKSSNVPRKELWCFESVELELGLSTSDEDDSKYLCPVFLHKDESLSWRYYATHSAGVHSVTITCWKDLNTFINAPDVDSGNDCLDAIFIQDSKPEYLVCTKTGSSEKAHNYVVGFALYYAPSSLLTLLSDGNMVSLGISTTAVLPPINNEDLGENLTANRSLSDVGNMSQFKQMLKEPFDLYMEKILKTNMNQPILKLGGGVGGQTHRECYELLQRASQVFREFYFENHKKARDELDKRVRALQMMKDMQLGELERINEEKGRLQEKAEFLAEKYEDIKDKQDAISKRCKRLSVLVFQRKSVLSKAEEEFIKDLQNCALKVDSYKNSIEKLKTKVKYQELQITNWRANDERKLGKIGETHQKTIRANLTEMSSKIASMIKEINEFKNRLNLK